jgi:hypothetical protein
MAKAFGLTQCTRERTSGEPNRRSGAAAHSEATSC